MLIEQILGISSSQEFERMALRLFAHQAESCRPYAEYISLLGINNLSSIDTLEKIPFLPISIFKSHRAYSGRGEPEITFTSSTTGGNQPAYHHMERVGDYEKTLLKGFSRFYSDPAKYSFYALLPSYLEREGSSLIYMTQRLIERSREGGSSAGGGFYLDNYQQLLEDMERDPKPKILLGVSYALLELAERYAPKLSDTIVMETGGMKGRREELPKQELHRILCSAFGVDRVASEYSMAELSSQAYSTGEGLFRCPEWMSIVIRDINDPFDFIGKGRAGGVNIIDLANISSCAFIQTDDMGLVHQDGGFEVLGRIDRGEIRGCNLLIE